MVKGRLLAYDTGKHSTCFAMACLELGVELVGGLQEGRQVLEAGPSKLAERRLCKAPVVHQRLEWCRILISTWEPLRTVIAFLGCVRGREPQAPQNTTTLAISSRSPPGQGIHQDTCRALMAASCTAASSLPSSCSSAAYAAGLSASPARGTHLASTSAARRRSSAASGELSAISCLVTPNTFRRRVSQMQAGERNSLQNNVYTSNALAAYFHGRIEHQMESGPGGACF